MKKKNIRIMALLLALIMVFALSSCGGGNKDNNNDNTVKTEQWYFGGATLKKFDVEGCFDGKENTLNPSSVYASVNFDEKLIRGVYALDDMEKDIKDVRKNIAFEEVTFQNGTFSISSVPIAICFGAEHMASAINNYAYSEFEAMTDYEIAALQFATADDVGRIVCTYELDGSSLNFKQIVSTNEAEEPFAYEFTGVEFSFDFKIAGPNITVSKGDVSITLTAYSFTENNGDDLWVCGYSKFDSSLIGELDYFSHSDDFNYAVLRDGSYYDMSALRLDSEGRATVYLSEDDLVNEPQEAYEDFAYIVISDGNPYFNSFGIIFFDGERIYDYSDTISQREARILKDTGVDISGLTSEEIKEIAEKKKDLFDDLQEEFRAQGINVSVNRSTGEIAMDASVLFGGDSAVVTEDGKALLDKFLTVYTSIIFNEKYNGFITKTLVEGHTAPVPGSTYEGDLPLSEERAENVIAYCLSEESAGDTQKLEGTFEAIGCSLKKPVYGADGEIDMDACRRVSFRFMINVNA